jgi:hypothetical protein
VPSPAEPFSASSRVGGSLLRSRGNIPYELEVVLHRGSARGWGGMRQPSQLEGPAICTRVSGSPEVPPETFEGGFNRAKKRAPSRDRYAS